MSNLVEIAFQPCGLSGYRNGYRSRSLLTKFGLIEDLRVPRDREGHYQPTVLPRYQRRQERVNRLVREMFLQGVSTRQVAAVLEPLLGISLSAQTVSRIARSLDAEVRRFQERLLEDCYQYLLLDGITLKVKGASGVKKCLVLCAYGITPEGRREMISFRQAASEAAWARPRRSTRPTPAERRSCASGNGQPAGVP